MNKHIELVKKWLDDPSSVTVKELKENAKAAAVYDAAAYATNAADTADTFAAAYAAAALAADYAADAADAADLAAHMSAVYAAAKYVKEYEELTGEFGEVK